MKHLIAQINQNTKRFTESFGGLTVEQINWKPNVKTWSIAQNIHHIIVMNETYFREISELKNGNGKKPFLAKFDFVVNFIGNQIAQYAEPTRKKRTQTFKLWKPATSDFPVTILSDFEKHQEKFKSQIKQAMPLVKKGVVIQSPATNLLFFKLEKVLDFLVSHEERHFNQAQEIFEEMKNNKPQNQRS